MNTFKENNKGLSQPTPNNDDYFYLDHADYTCTIQRQFYLSKNDAFYLFEEMEYRGIFDTCTSVEECEAAIKEYILAGSKEDNGQHDDWYTYSENYYNILSELFTVDDSDVLDTIFNAIGASGLFGNCTSIEAYESAIFSYKIIDELVAIITYEPPKVTNPPLPEDWWKEFKSLR